MRAAIIILSVVVFALFYLVGFDIPCEDNPTYNEPMFTDVLIVFMWLILAVAVIVALWSLIRTIRDSRNSSGKVFGVPVRKISFGIAIITIVMLILSFLLSSTDPIMINGKSYDDSFWLSVAGMFIFSTTVLLVIAIGAVIFGKLQLRKINSKPYKNENINVQKA